MPGVGDVIAVATRRAIAASGVKSTENHIITLNLIPPGPRFGHGNSCNRVLTLVTYAPGCEHVSPSDGPMMRQQLLDFYRVHNPDNLDNLDEARAPSCVDPGSL